MLRLPCVQPHASAAAAAAAHKQRSLVVVTSLSSLSIFASILFTHLFLNIYPTPIVQWLKKRIFNMCTQPNQRKTRMFICVKERGDYAGVYVCLTRWSAPGKAGTSVTVTAEIMLDPMNWRWSTNKLIGTFVTCLKPIPPSPQHWQTDISVVKRL